MGHGIEQTARRSCANALAATVIVGCFIGCGSDEAETRRVSSMIAAPSITQADPSGRNAAPVVGQITIRPARPAPGRTVRVNAIVSDPDGDSTRLTFRWETSAGRALGEGRQLDTEGLEQGSLIRVIATASDGQAESEPMTFTFRLAQASTEIALVVIDASEGTNPGALLTAVVESSDDDGGRRFETRFEWQVNGEVVGTEKRLETERFSPGDVVVVRVRIDADRGLTRPVTSPPIVLSRGSIPEIVSKPLAGIEGGVFRYRIQARSAEPRASLVYELITGPEGMRVDSKSGVVLWHPTTLQRGRFEVEVSVKDQWGSGVAQSFAIVADSPTTPAARAR